LHITLKMRWGALLNKKKLKAGSVIDLTVRGVFCNRSTDGRGFFCHPSITPASGFEAHTITKVCEPIMKGW
jgi:hypothetical protein